MSDLLDELRARNVSLCIELDEANGRAETWHGRFRDAQKERLGLERSLQDLTARNARFERDNARLLAQLRKISDVLLGGQEGGGRAPIVVALDLPVKEETAGLGIARSPSPTVLITPETPVKSLPAVIDSPRATASVDHVPERPHVNTSLLFSPDTGTPSPPAASALKLGSTTSSSLPQATQAVAAATFEISHAAPAPAPIRARRISNPPTSLPPTTKTTSAAVKPVKTSSGSTSASRPKDPRKRPSASPAPPAESEAEYEAASSFDSSNSSLSDATTADSNASYRIPGDSARSTSFAGSVSLVVPTSALPSGPRTRRGLVEHAKQFKPVRGLPAPAFADREFWPQNVEKELAFKHFLKMSPSPCLNLYVLHGWCTTKNCRYRHEGPELTAAQSVALRFILEPKIKHGNRSPAVLAKGYVRSAASPTKSDDATKPSVFKKKSGESAAKRRKL